MKIENLRKKYVPITRKDVELIIYARKSVLYNEDELWLKKEGDFCLEHDDGA